ncbi:hypothetical protein ACRWQL_11520 [Shewanella sp. HL-SH4]|uniref:hypothetical protein n=1 Tax=Shewanella sp. HL-SH4 TaxID=3436240 RepID=UPI003EC0F565
MNNESNRLFPQSNMLTLADLKAKCLNAIGMILLYLFSGSIQAKDLEIGVSFSIPPMSFKNLTVV